MPLSTAEQRDQITALVADCIIRRRTNAEIRDELEHVVGRKLRLATISDYRERVRVAELQKQNYIVREGYLFELYQRINELNGNYKRLVDMLKECDDMENSKGEPVSDYQKIHLKRLIEMDLSELTMKLNECYDALPFVSAVQKELRKASETPKMIVQ